MSSNPQNTFITSVAILMVVVTLYFTTNALKRNYEQGQLKIGEATRIREYERQQQELIKKHLEEKELQRQADISARLKEYKDFCYDLQIFTAEFKIEEDSLKTITITTETTPTTTTTTDKSNEILLKQLKKTNRKKDLNKTQPPKKGTTSEPIIYLFVLVLLYLLLRAASDITQHYKEQSKGDKRNNRRCSLQVYAQMKSDRRPSKGIFQNIYKYFKP